MINEALDRHTYNTFKSEFIVGCDLHTRFVDSKIQKTAKSNPLSDGVCLE